MKKYYVKTRNWTCKKSIFKLISLIPSTRGDGYTDGDGKFYYETNSLLLAFMVWTYWKTLAYWSRGWTYIRNQRKYPDGLSGSYNNFYL